MGKGDSKSEQNQKSLTANDESILSASGGSTVYDVSNVDGGVAIEVNGLPGSDAVKIVQELTSLGTTMAEGFQAQLDKTQTAVSSIATTATGTQTELDRLVNKLILPGVLLVGGMMLLPVIKGK